MPREYSAVSVYRPKTYDLYDIPIPNIMFRRQMQLCTYHIILLYYIGNCVKPSGLNNSEFIRGSVRRIFNIFTPNCSIEMNRYYIISHFVVITDTTWKTDKRVNKRVKHHKTSFESVVNYYV